MHIIFLGKEKHHAQPLFQKILQIGTSRGHTVSLWDKRTFLASDLSSVDVVCLKSHFDVDAVWAKIEASDVIAINNRTSSQHCLDRRHLDKLLKTHSIPTPQSAFTPSAVAALTYPIMQKPVDAGDHDVRVLAHPPSSPDCQRFFYQEKILSRGYVYKLYVIGEHAFALSEDEEAHRRKATLTDDLHHLSKRVGEVTGLTLFGADIMSHNSRSYVIDVNPFPSFTGIPGAAEILWDCLSEHDGYCPPG